MILNIKGYKIDLSKESHISPQNRPFRLSSIEAVGNQVWINKVLCTGTIYTFRYLDKEGGFFGFEFDERGNFKTKVQKC